MLKDADGSPDGITVRKYLAGEVHELPSAPLPRFSLPSMFIDDSFAEEVPAPAEEDAAGSHIIVLDAETEKAEVIEQPKEETVDAEKPAEVTDQPKAELPESAQPKNKKK